MKCSLPLPTLLVSLLLAFYTAKIVYVFLNSATILGNLKVPLLCRFFGGHMEVNSCFSGIGPCLSECGTLASSGITWELVPNWNSRPRPPHLNQRTWGWRLAAVVCEALVLSSLRTTGIG